MRGWLLAAGATAAMTAATAGAQVTNKLALAAPVTYDNKYEVFGGLMYQNFQAGQNLPRKMNLGGVEVQGTYWLTRKFGVAADVRGSAGTTGVFPNSDLSRPLVVMYTGMGGVNYRGPKNKRAAIDFHAYAGAAHGVFDETARQDLDIGLYKNKTAPMFAVGTSFDFNHSKNVAIRLSPDLILERFGTETREFFAISGGLVYRFGSK